MYTVILCTVKFSILSLYWRIFSRMGIKQPVFITAGFVACWGIAVVYIVSQNSDRYA